MIKLSGSFSKSEIHRLAFKIPRFKYVNINEVIGNKLELEEVLVKKLREVSKMLLSAFVSTPSPRFFREFSGGLLEVCGLQLVTWPHNFAMRHHWLLSGFDLENQTVS